MSKEESVYPRHSHFCPAVLRVPPSVCIYFNIDYLSGTQLVLQSTSVNWCTAFGRVTAVLSSVLIPKLLM